MIADPHFGKGAMFRRQGIPVPSGTTGDDLRRLDHLVERFTPDRLIVLGDFFHGPDGLSEQTLDRIAAWRKKRSGLVISVIRGNHDRRCVEGFRTLSLMPVATSLDLGPFHFQHEASEAGSGYVVSGHLHPGVQIALGPGDRRYFPCFLFGSSRAVLPAFGSFTGLGRIVPVSGDRVFVSAPERVMEFPR